MDWAALLALIRLKPILINGLAVLLAILLRQGVIESSTPLWAIYLLFALGDLGVFAALWVAVLSWREQPLRDFEDQFIRSRAREQAIDHVRRGKSPEEARLLTEWDSGVDWTGMRLRAALGGVQIMCAFWIAVGVPLGAIIASPVP